MEKAKRNYSLKFNLMDIIVSIIMIAFLVASIITTNILFKGDVTSDNATVEIHLNNEIVYQQRLSDLKDNETTVVLKKEDYPTLLGDMTFTINKELGVKVTEVTCPNHWCYNQGYVKKAGIPLTCVPNHVFIIIVNDLEDGVDIIIG